MLLLCVFFETSGKFTTPSPLPTFTLCAFVRRDTGLCLLSPRPVPVNVVYSPSTQTSSYIAEHVLRDTPLPYEQCSPIVQFIVQG